MVARIARGNFAKGRKTENQAIRQQCGIHTIEYWKTNAEMNGTVMDRLWVVSDKQA
jgi:hypothetical protein